MRCLTFLLLLPLVVLVTSSSAHRSHSVSSTDAELQFSKWMQQHRVTYDSPAERSYRLGIFTSNLEFILRRNVESRHGGIRLRMNRFGDLTNEEFQARYARPAMRMVGKHASAPRHSVRLPQTVDWVAAGKVTPIVDEGQCGASWAFATVDPVASAYAIKYQTSPVPLSAEEVAECGSSGGCSGASLADGYAWIVKNGGVATAAAYTSNGTCQASTTPNFVSISGVVNVQPDDSVAVAEAVAIGPVTAAVDAGSPDWQFYSGGIISDANCGTDLDHALTIVGYGVTPSKQQYWILKNSWGSSWGMNGYAWVAKDENTSSPGECGIAMAVTYPSGVTKL